MVVFSTDFSSIINAKTILSAPFLFDFRLLPAHQLLLLPIKKLPLPINQVALPVFSTLRHHTVQVLERPEHMLVNLVLLEVSFVHADLLIGLQPAVDFILDKCLLVVGGDIIECLFDGVFYAYHNGYNSIIK